MCIRDRYTAKPLQLEGASNVRDLGGYPTANGRTCFRRLLRGDHLSALTIKDKECIYDYGVRYVVDLRSRMECESRPDALIGWRDVQYCSIPMLDQINSSDFRGQIPDSMGELDVYKRQQQLIAPAEFLTILILMVEHFFHLLAADHLLDEAVDRCV